MAWDGLKADYYKKWRKNNNVSFASMALNKANLNKYLKSSGTIDRITDNKDGTFTIKYTNKTGTFTFIANEKGEVKFYSGFKIDPSNEITLNIKNNDDDKEKESRIFEAVFSDIKEKKVKWELVDGDKTVVKLSANTGKQITVTAQKEGTVTLRVKSEDGELEDSCKITVTESSPVISIGELYADSLTLRTNGTTIRTPLLNPQRTTEKLEWSSSDTSTLTVEASPDGKKAEVRALKQGNATITAQIKKDNEVISSDITIMVSDTVPVIFKADGEVVATVQTTIGGNISFPSNPEKEGREFFGWYDAETGGTKYEAGATINNSITLYARYRVNMTFITGEGVSKVDPVKVMYGEVAKRPNPPTKEGSYFDGWCTDEERTQKYEFNTPVIEDITLYDTWREEYLAPTTSAINTDKYGYRVKGYNAKNYNGYWRLYYQDEEKTYIIADQTNTTYKPSSNYSSYSNGLSVSEEGQNLNYKLKLNGSFFNNTNTSVGIKATAWLTDTGDNSKWSKEYKDNEEIASYAIGSPTLELFLESYKATHPNETRTYTIQSYGYSISDFTFIKLDNNGIYGSDSTYWIASPTKYNYDTSRVGICYVQNNCLNWNSTYNCSVTNNAYAVRPIVCIPTQTFKTSCILIENER